MPAVMILPAAAFVTFQRINGAEKEVQAAVPVKDNDADRDQLRQTQKVRVRASHLH